MKTTGSHIKAANVLEEAAKKLHKTAKYIKEISSEKAKSSILKTYYSLCTGYQYNVQNDNFNGIF